MSGVLFPYNARMVERFNISAETELETVAAAILEQAKRCRTDTATLVTFSGDLGAGKTTLIKFIATQLGVGETVTSPTFMIMRSYQTSDTRFTQLAHIDAYRVESEDEMRVLRFTELLGTPQTLVCLEWPERVPGLLAEEQLAVTIALHGEDREITITDHEKK